MLKIARDIVAKISLFCSLESALIDMLEELQKEQYKIREDNKRCVATNRSLEARYSELMYAFNSVKKDMPAELRQEMKVLSDRLDKLEKDGSNAF